ncbi:MAG: methyl-accepting chemotaxis protein [Deltaproteobacteria bacterium]|nr:MAG: methyl-accepting chemotaxis protein [Deltaproteobacteria bacterium]
MTNYGRQMLMAGEEEKISSIKTDKIAQTAKRIESSLGTLASFSYEEDMGSAELKTILQKMETDFVLLRSVLTDGKQSLAVLRSQWLGEQKSLSLRNNALKETADSLTASLKNIQLSADRVRHQAEEEAVQTSQAAEWVISVVCLSAIAFMILVGTLIIRRIVIPINKAVAFAIIISNGDLTAEIQKDHDDEVGNLVSKLSDMAHNLNALIGQVQRSGIQVTSSATELSATSRQQEAVMRTQLESTNYVVKSVGEISSISEDLVETMKKVASMSDQTADFASSGQSDLSHMEEAMHHMENASKSISGKLEAINEKAANITSVVTTITKVADQTNLLSLNAAIEAEKAGEYGRGFTVVAREIRRLADQTAVATLDIDQMVQEMQSAVSAGVMEMDAFITEVQRSAENVGKISMQLSRIIEQVKALSPSFEGVNESMQFQAQNAQQINSSMLNLSEEMQQTVDSLRESFMAIEQLNDAASGLQDEVSRFRVM